MASGNLWKTENNGITWSPVFEHEGAYALGVVELDPRNPNTVWVGTGENNSQRSVGYGDGVYRSLDGGKSWENMGLNNSGHISMIRVHPDNSDIVWVAAQGPLWNPGGDRGLYKTTDAGKSWTRILNIDENTGESRIGMQCAVISASKAGFYETNLCRQGDLSMAGAMPPRVIATTARHEPLSGPCPSSRRPPAS